MSTNPGMLQRKCACGQHTGGECEECSKKKMTEDSGAGSLQRHASTESSPNIAPPIVHDVLRSQGQPLDAATRQFFEPRFGCDFSGVRVHTDARAAESARAVNALAYTVGRDVVFGVGHYAPWTSAGQRLIAHELTHTIQQRFRVAPFSVPLQLTAPGDGSEQEADLAASALMKSNSVDPRSDETLKVARDTPRPASPAPVPAPPTSAKRKACVSSERIPDNRAGLTLLQGEVHDYLEMNIDWDSKGLGCDCKCGEYRQFVKGFMKVNGRKKPIPLCSGASLEENVYHEDADEKGVCYGHRGNPATSIDKFIDLAGASGCGYRGRDMPGFAGAPESHVDMLLTFKGQSYDVCTDTYGKVYEWKVEFKGFVP